MTLQKLVHIYPDSDSDDSDSDSESDSESLKSVLSKRSGKLSRMLTRTFRRAFRRSSGQDRQKALETGKTSFQGELEGYLNSQYAELSRVTDISKLRTLQRYHASPNDPRAQFMEKNSALASRNLAVACEQVSMFITNDNSIISFFEQSAQDVEAPIIRRLQTSDTIIRQSVRPPPPAAGSSCC